MQPPRVDRSSQPRTLVGTQKRSLHPFIWYWPWFSLLFQSSGMFQTFRKLHLREQYLHLLPICQVSIICTLCNLILATILWRESYILVSYLKKLGLRRLTWLTKDLWLAGSRARIGTQTQLIQKPKIIPAQPLDLTPGLLAPCTCPVFLDFGLIPTWLVKAMLSLQVTWCGDTGYVPPMAPLLPCQAQSAECPESDAFFFIHIYTVPWDINRDIMPDSSHATFPPKHPVILELTWIMLCMLLYREMKVGQSGHSRVLL